MSTAVKEIISLVKTKDNYVPRDYQTIGGMWTVDTWKIKDITVKLMDEGYTTVLESPTLKVVTGYNGKEYCNFEVGSEEEAEKILKSFKKVLYKIKKTTI